MDIEEISDYVASLEGVLTLRPQPGDGAPEISWGDVFFYYAPEGRVPNGQPFATVVTKDYPDEPGWTQGRPGAFRLNIAAADDVAKAGTSDRAGTLPDPGTADTWTAHPVYGQLGWIAVVNPGERTGDEALSLLRAAHTRARARYERRNAGT